MKEFAQDSGAPDTNEAAKTILEKYMRRPRPGQDSLGTIAVQKIVGKTGENLRRKMLDQPYAICSTPTEKEKDWLADQMAAVELLEGEEEVEIITEEKEVSEKTDVRLVPETEANWNTAINSDGTTAKPVSVTDEQLRLNRENNIMLRVLHDKAISGDTEISDEALRDAFETLMNFDEVLGEKT